MFHVLLPRTVHLQPGIPRRFFVWLADSGFVLDHILSSSLKLILIGNTLTLLSGLIAAGLYGNIGVKVFYNNVLVDIFKAPLLTSKGGKIAYAVIVPIWWSIAFIIAGAIPAYVYFVGVMSASCLLNLSYTIPPWLILGYDIKKATMGTFDPAVGRTSRGLTGINRYIRGFFTGGPLKVAFNVWHLLYFLTSLGLCGLGMYASIDG